MEFIKSTNIITSEKRACLEDYLTKCISDDRLLRIPIEEEMKVKNSKVVIQYHSGDNYLTINIKCGGTTYFDNCLDYFYKKDGITTGKINTNWNEVLDIINKWHTNTKTA